MLTTRIPLFGPPAHLLGRPALLGPVRLAQMQFPSQGPLSAADELLQTGAVVEVTITNPAGGSGGTPVTLRAMIDTGASISTIVTSIADRAGLQQTGSTQLSGVGGVQTSAIYAASLAIPQFGVVIPAVEVASIPNPLPDVEMLLGRDVLRNMALNYHGPAGSFALATDAAPPAGGISPQTTPGAAPTEAKSSLPLVLGGLAAAGLVTAGLFAFKVF